MKKTTLFFILLLIGFQITIAQQTISFESEESYILGDINAQNGWTTTGCGDACNIENQVISDEMSSEGTYSLKIDNESAYSGQDSPIVGAFYDYTTNVPYLDSTFSADIYISETGGANFRMGNVNLTQGVFTTIFEFDYQGNIFVLDDGSFYDTLIEWSAETWYNVRIEIYETTAKYFLDNVEIHEASITPYDTEQFRFAHDNWGGYAYIDNFKTNDENLSIEENTLPPIKHFFNQSTNELVVEQNGTNLESYTIYNLMGQQVFSGTLEKSREVIDMNDLQSGVYLSQITSSNQTSSFKFVKSR
ncbi:T9SS type A sorting domain-containing protein [Mangrovimonas sp. AS39]|uniref:T9SS type A sorting domain-containing protein n=1 Tax=Mangrovimonas TaxID=1211036 RepID=UPI00141D9E60|nr:MULTISPECIES: T9SS type A sorting domain-containing protein [Mangrovimonas]MCF1192433.1 T9SS type A sorting domain-containing protein [Mangrovimonas futianensis]MCF1196237.1 T9SS type A sorting domain-containing protein [Mangrovimonas futianensis]NIK93024.1 T9SS type A sorting domain-containing protein [Mangrovimonas sp. CR14]